MYGNKNNNGVLVSLDFSGIHERECTGMSNKDNNLFF